MRLLTTKSARLHRHSGVQVAEFALVLPLLITMAIAVMDFGTAANMRQKLSNAAREGARFASTQPIADINRASGAPMSTSSVSEVVYDYLAAAHVLPNAGQGTCTVAGSTATMSADGTATWTYQFTGCPDTLTIRINRNFSLGNTDQGATLLATRLEVDYPYTWQLGRVIGLISPGSTLFSHSSTLAGVAIMPNLY